jgi:hypothetical protein
MIILMLHNMAITCIFVFDIAFFLNFSDLNLTYVTPSNLRRRRIVCASCETVWSSYGGVSV